MGLLRVKAGENAPDEVHVIIENPMGGAPVKYEMDKKTGAIFVDRFLHTCMFYPGNYGYIPETLSEDGDPVDVLVVGTVPVIPGAVVLSRPIGVLVMRDEKGMDEKIIAVPVAKLHPYHERIDDVSELPAIQREQIEHFFAHYKDLEKGKWVRMERWANANEARRLILEGIERAKI